MKEIVLFSISEPYLELRQKLAIVNRLVASTRPPSSRSWPPLWACRAVLRADGAEGLASVRADSRGRSDRHRSRRERGGDANAAVAARDGAVAGTRSPPTSTSSSSPIDCLRADMPWAGYPRPIAPRLTALEARSVDFTTAYSDLVVHVDEPRRAARREAARRDAPRRLLLRLLPKENVLFPELLHASRVRTLARARARLLQRRGLRAGVRPLGGRPRPRSGTTRPTRTSPRPRLEALAEKLLSDPARGTGRFFAWFHFLDPHDRYMPHEGIGPYGETSRDLYDAEVTFTDGYVGKLLDFIAAQPWGAPHRLHRHRRPRRGVRRAPPVRPRVRALGEPRARPALHRAARGPRRVTSTSRRAPSTSPRPSSISRRGQRRRPAGSTAAPLASRGRASSRSCSARRPARARRRPRPAARRATATGAAPSSTVT